MLKKKLQTTSENMEFRHTAHSNIVEMLELKGIKVILIAPRRCVEHLLLPGVDFYWLTYSCG